MGGSLLSHYVHSRDEGVMDYRHLQQPPVVFEIKEIAIGGEQCSLWRGRRRRRRRRRRKKKRKKKTIGVWVALLD